MRAADKRATASSPLCARAACTARAQHACARCGQAATCSEGCADAIWEDASATRAAHGHAPWCANVGAHDWWRVGARDRGPKRPRTDGGPDDAATRPAGAGPAPAATQPRTEQMDLYLRYLDQLRSPYLFLRNLVQYLPSGDQAELLAQLRTSTARTERAPDGDVASATATGSGQATGGGNRAPDASDRAELYRATEELLTVYGNIYSLSRVYDSDNSNYRSALLTYSLAPDGVYEAEDDWRLFARSLPTYAVHKSLGTGRVYPDDADTRDAFMRTTESAERARHFRDTVYIRAEDAAGTPILVNRPIVPLFVRTPISSTSAMVYIFTRNRAINPIATRLPAEIAGDPQGARVRLTAAQMQRVLTQWRANGDGAQAALAPWTAALERLSAHAARRSRRKLDFPTPLHLWWALHATSQNAAAMWITPVRDPPADAKLPRDAAAIDRRMLDAGLKSERERQRVIASWKLGIGGSLRLLPLDDTYRAQSELRDTTDLRALSFGLAADTPPERVAAYWEGAERVWRDLVLPAWFHDAPAKRALLGTGAAYLLVRPDNPRSNRTVPADKYLAYAAEADADAPGYALERAPWTGVMIAFPRDPPPGQRDFPPNTAPHAMLAPVLLGGNALGELLMAHRQALRRSQDGVEGGGGGGAEPATALSVRALADAYARDRGGDDDDDDDDRAMEL